MKVAKSNNRTHEPERKKNNHTHTQQQQQQPLITQFDREIRECLEVRPHFNARGGGRSFQ